MREMQDISGRYQYPTRDEWAKERRTPYYDRFPDTPALLAEYATPEEIAALKIGLRERWRELGQKLREFPAKAEPESREERLRTFAGGERSERVRIHDSRSSINAAIETIENGELPLYLENYSGSKDIFVPFHARYEAAKAELYERTLREIEQTPVDDDAWAAELKRREYVEECLANLSKAALRR
jgi:hypothetical protein